MFFRFADPILRSAAQKAVSQYGGYFEDHYAEAQWTYVRALRTYRRGIGTFPGYLRMKLKRAFADANRTERRQRHGLLPDKRSPILIRSPLMDRPVTDHFVNRLDDDDLLVMRKAISLGRRKKPREVQPALTKFLRKLGWTAERISESFNEIRKALTQ